MKCGKEFNQKCHWINHTEKKKHPCIIIGNNSNIFPNIPKLSHENSSLSKSINPNDLNSIPKPNSNLNSNLNSNSNSNPISNQPDEEVTIQCGFCAKIFSNTGNLNKHIKFNCKIKKQQDEKKEEIFKQLLLKDEIIRMQNEKMTKQDETIYELCKKFKKMEEQNNELQKQINNLNLNKLIGKSSKSNKSNKLNKSNRPNVSNLNNLTNANITNNNLNNNTINSNNTNTNTTNNIVMVNFGKEDLKMIDNHHFMKIVKNPQITGVKIPEEVLKIIHFNPAYPQLSNIYISDINREKCMVFEDNEWKLSPTDKIPEIIDKVVTYTYDKQEEFKELYGKNKNMTDRLDVINKYTQFNDNEYLQQLIDEQEDPDDFIDNKDKIKRCEDFQKKTYNTIKTTLYNEGKKIKN
jgi:hypothetical protein